jgi:ferric-dicitrate binding protein FerR (iron transport regulator)
MNEPDLELIRDYLDDRISPEGLERLNRLLETDADARAEFRAMATLEEGLRDLSIASEFSFPDHEPFAAEHKPKRHARRSYRAEHIGIATLLLVCLGLAALSLWNSDHEDEWGDTIARIEFLSKDVAFDPDHQLPSEQGSLLSKGWIQLERGRVRILFRSGTTLETEGPAALGIDTPMRAYLDFGKVMVHAPESGRDFVVATESMEVVDLGTRFEVSVDPQSRESKVSVIEGLVDLHLGSRGAERMIRPLEAGYAARVDAIGKIVEITSGTGTHPLSEPDEPRILAHWTFDELDADGTVLDSTGRQLDGILRGGKHSDLVPGVSGQALAFEEQNVAVDLSEHVLTLAQLDVFTFATWVRDPDHSLAMLFSFSGDSEQHRLQFYLSSRFVRFGWQDGLHYDSISGRVDGWSSGQWYHVAVTADRGVVRLYRDGEQLASGSIGSKIGTPASAPSMVKNASRAYLGRLDDGRQGDATAHQWFKGQMDDAQLYSGAVSQRGIQFLYEHPGEIWNPGESLQ